MARHGSRRRNTADEWHLDQTIADSFPASDPPSHSGITGVGRCEGPEQADDRGASHTRGHEARPTGSPNWDRHAIETAHSWEDEDKS
jgi:hypothetical protein